MSAPKRNKKKELRLNKKRDFVTLKFLWSWKLATTSAIQRKAFPESKPHTAYRRLWQLRKAGYIKLVRENISESYFWVLTQKGFRVIVPILPELKENGYLSESPWHDLVTQAAHLSGFLSAIPEGITLISEQSLRRLPVEIFPDWIPGPHLHRSDGYTYFEKTQKLLSVEVELSQKIIFKIRETASFYKNHKGVDCILWVVKSPHLLRLIRKQIAVTDVALPHRHNFILLDEFLENGWQSKVVEGEFKSKTISELMSKLSALDISKTRHQVDFSAILKGNVSIR